MYAYHRLSSACENYLGKECQGTDSHYREGTALHHQTLRRAISVDVWRMVLSNMLDPGQVGLQMLGYTYGTIPFSRMAQKTTWTTTVITTDNKAYCD